MAYSSSGLGNPFGFRVTPWVKRLLIINAVVSLVVWAFSGLRPFLQFTPSDALLQPWTLVTYMFVHGDVMHLLFNMLGLFFFGPPLEERWGGREFLKFWFVAGIGGALLSLLFPGAPIIGASAAVYGILVAFAMYWPDNPIYIWGIFPVKAKWLVAFFVGMSVFYAVTGGQAGVAHLAHLGGAAAGFLYLRSPWAPPAWRSGGGAASWTPGGSPQRERSAPKKWKAFLPGQADARKDEQPEPRPARSIAADERILDEVDRILDKISRTGLDSLTEDERRQLDEASRRFRTS